MTEKLGVKETKEALLAVIKVSSILVKQFKDGAQVADVQELFEKIIKDENVKSAILLAYEGYNQIPDEVKDIDMKEAIELLMAAAPEILNVIEALKE